MTTDAARTIPVLLVTGSGRPRNLISSTAAQPGATATMQLPC